MWPVTFNALNAFIHLHNENSLNFTEINLKVKLSPSKKICVICFSEALLKMIKNAFYFMLKALLVLNIFSSFYHDFFGHAEKMAWLERQS